MKHVITVLILFIAFPSFGQTAEEYVQLGNTKFEQGDFPSAYSYFSQAIKLDKENAVAYYNRGRANQKMLNFKKAISDYSSAISISPNFIEAYFNRGYAYDQIDDFKKAVQGNSSQVCQDLKKARDLGFKGLSNDIKFYCNE